MATRRFLLAVTGGIAAYKAPELIRHLIRGGHSVRCVMTPEAEQFVSPLVLQTLSGYPVRSRLFDAAEEGQIDHIALADWAELIVVAPATANVIARFCHGLADDLVTTVVLATRAPVLVAPAMNVNMWNHAATQSNVEVLRGRGIRFVGPESGELACGWEGPGRMSDPELIAEAAELALRTAALAGQRLLVTAGGTREPLDAVRSFSNRSSGRMGFAIAAEAARRGADVVLVAAPTSLTTPAGVQRVDIETAEEMRAAVLREWPSTQIVVKAAAVADFRPVERRTEKIKKEDLAEGEGLSIQLERTPDILAEICREKGDRVVVGFAAESHDVIAGARRKLLRKGCDFIVANDISRSDGGFDVETNQVSFIWPGGEVEALPLLTKRDVAVEMLDRIEKLCGGRVFV